MTNVTFEYQYVDPDRKFEAEVKANPKKYVDISKSGRLYGSGWYSSTKIINGRAVNFNYNEDRDLLDVIVTNSGVRF